MRKAIVAAVICSSFIAMCRAADEAAATDRKGTRMPAQPLSAALRALANDRGANIIFVTEDVGNRQSPAMEGQWTLDEALTVMLGGTGLTFRHLDARTVAVEPSSPPASQPGNEKAPAKDVEQVGARSAGSEDSGQSDAIQDQSKGGKMKNSGFWRHLAAMFVSTAGVTAHAQTAADTQEAQVGTLEEVVVTAERRAEDIQKAAMSVSVRSGEDLASEGKYSLSSILEDVPGIQGGAAATNAGATVSGTDNQASGLVIRGIPSNIGVGGGTVSVASAAAIYVDGIYEGVGGGYDIERVEALRGPQGTLYGRSATSGLVAIHTRNPKLGEFTGNVSLEAGSQDLRHVSGGINLPLGDTVALRLSGNKYERDGYYVERGGSTSNTDGRMKLLIQPSDTFSMLLGAALQNNKTITGGTTTTLTAPNTLRTVSTPATLSPGQNEYRQYWAELNWDTGLGHLTYQPAYRTWSSQTDFSSRPVTVPSGGFDQFTSTDKDNFWTHELHLASNPGSKLTWQVGAFYYDNALHNFNTFNRYPSGGFYRSQDISRDTTAWSGFAEATYPFTDATRLTAGLRFDKTTVQVNEIFLNNLNCNTNIPGGVDSPNYCLPSTGNVAVGTLSGDAGKRTFNKWTYKLRLEHDLTPDNLVYAMVSTGVSPGDIVLAVDLRQNVTVNGVSVANPDYQKPVPKEIASETLTSYEIGSKNRFLDNKLQINGDIFYYDYGAYTVANANVNGSLVNGVFVVISTPTQFETLSAPLTTYGLELETLFQLTPNDRIGFNYSYTKTQFHDKNRPVYKSDATFGDFFGYDEVPTVVPHRASLSYDHSFDLSGGSKLVAGVATRYLSPHRENGNIMSRGSKAQVSNPLVANAIAPYFETEGDFITDLNLNWSSPAGKYSVTGWMRNVFDHVYKTAVNLQNVNATNVANGTAFNAIAATPSEPRTYGVAFNVRW